jgi:trehalose utilization protein
MSPRTSTSPQFSTGRLCNGAFYPAGFGATFMLDNIALAHQGHDGPPAAAQLPGETRGQAHRRPLGYARQNARDDARGRRTVVTGASPIRVVVWGENLHEQRDAAVAEIYPAGMHTVIGEAISDSLGSRVSVRTATMQDAEHGLTEDIIGETDVLIWWGHLAHDAVADDVVKRIHRAVLSGMGIIVLHSGHLSKIFTTLMGTSCALDWRSAGDRELMWTVASGHPIAQGVPHPIVLEREEMYGEPFDVPRPDELVFVSSFSGGEVFRSGCTYQRGRGRVFYFRPGDQEYPTYHHGDIQRVICNAVQWAAPATGTRQSPRLNQRPLSWFVMSPTAR